MADYGKQKARLRELLQPQLDAGATVGGSIGLEWLLEGAALEPEPEPEPELEPEPEPEPELAAVDQAVEVDKSV